MSKVLLDTERSLRWGPYSAQVKLGELDRPPNLRDLQKEGPKQMRALIAVAWACLEETDPPHPFPTPAALAAWLDEHPAAIGALSKAVLDAFGEAQKKTQAMNSSHSAVST